MDGREALIQAAVELIEEHPQEPECISVRDICQRAGVGLGLVNYHFSCKKKLLKEAISRITAEHLQHFEQLRSGGGDPTPYDRLLRLSCLSVDFAFEHQAAARISILSDLSEPSEEDNTHRCCRAFLPLMAACRPDWSRQLLNIRCLAFVSLIQQSFLQVSTLGSLLETDFSDPRMRYMYIKHILDGIMEP